MSLGGAAEALGLFSGSGVEFGKALEWNCAEVVSQLR